MIPNDELQALKEADTLHMLPKEALIASIKYLAEHLLVRHEDAIRVAEALAYDPSCDGCLQVADNQGEPEPHRDDCAMQARDRILEVAAS